ncbi:kirola-like isoform X2 [Solanum stenotomum]|uniref:kirola-like isoform X2 n=1 Tax=Solanum stenotomum TaxID=172797 RepID=UPI0020D1643B|nr:kirola-like isoform X2 [Solanum stenotomum]
MSLEGKLVSEINIKCDGDVFHEIIMYKPHHMCNICPDKIQKVDIHEDGKEMVAKEVIEEIDEEKKLVKKKMIEGDMLEYYKSFYLTIHVETKGENNLVTWILKYEKKNANVPDPHTFMELCLNITKDIESYHIK